MKKVLLAGLSVLSVLSSSAMANQGDLIVRARAIAVTPDVSSTSVLSSIHSDLSTQVVPELDFTYMVTKNIGAELILGTSRHTLSSDLGNLGKVSVLPPTLTVQYHFAPEAKIRPYVGAGVNYTNFSSVNLPEGVSVKKNSFGGALQLGFDYALDKNWSLNFDVKKVYLGTKVTGAGLENAKFKVDPWLVGVGVGYRF